MLILTRKRREKIRVGHNGEITLTVLGVYGKQIRLGIDAPKTIPVHREEIYRKTHKANSIKEEYHVDTRDASDS